MRFGNVIVMLFGIACYSCGLMLASYTSSLGIMHLAIGVLIGTGILTTYFGMMLPAMVRMINKKTQSIVLGIGTAPGSLGQFLVTKPSLSACS